MEVRVPMTGKGSLAVIPFLRGHDVDKSFFRLSSPSCPRRRKRVRIFVFFFVHPPLLSPLFRILPLAWLPSTVFSHCFFFFSGIVSAGLVLGACLLFFSPLSSPSVSLALEI